MALAARMFWGLISPRAQKLASRKPAASENSFLPRWKMPGERSVNPGWAGVAGAAGA